MRFTRMRQETPLSRFRRIQSRPILSFCIRRSLCMLRNNGIQRTVPSSCCLLTFVPHVLFDLRAAVFYTFPTANLPFSPTCRNQSAFSCPQTYYKPYLRQSQEGFPDFFRICRDEIPFMRQIRRFRQKETSVLFNVSFTYLRAF